MGYIGGLADGMTLHTAMVKNIEESITVEAQKKAFRETMGRSMMPGLPASELRHELVMLTTDGDFEGIAEAHPLRLWRA